MDYRTVIENLKELSKLRRGDKLIVSNKDKVCKFHCIMKNMKSLVFWAA